MIHPVIFNTQSSTTFTNRFIFSPRNLGAKRVATSSTDTDAYGTYYQFGAAKCPVRIDELRYQYLFTIHPVIFNTLK
jgi:hypothetical protein